MKSINENIFVLITICFQKTGLSLSVRQKLLDLDYLCPCKATQKIRTDLDLGDRQTDLRRRWCMDFKLSLMELCNPSCFLRVIVAGLDQRSKDCLYFLASWFTDSGFVFSIFWHCVIIRIIHRRQKSNEAAAAGCAVDQIPFCYF